MITPKAVATVAKRTVTPVEEVVEFKQVKWPAVEVKHFRETLLKLRDRAVDGVKFLSRDNLQLVSGGQASLYEVNAALQRLDLGTYGACEQCHELIAKARLEAQPFAKLCIKCQSGAEKGKPRFRPLGKTLQQFEDIEE
ncbi:MAG: TraR/DksA family transcriptional regulator [Kiritimatiellaeota bacterium]|nr:TraR/DksA family transcriptional regulator [Kiritimatiellota bacterium]